MPLYLLSSMSLHSLPSDPHSVWDSWEERGIYTTVRSKKLENGSKGDENTVAEHWEG